MDSIQPQVIAAIVAALVSVVIFLGKESIDRRRASRLGALTLLWLAKSLKRNLVRQPEGAMHLSMAVVVSHVAEIAHDQLLSAAFDDIEEIMLTWKQGVYEGRAEIDPLCNEAAQLLQNHINALATKYGAASMSDRGHR